MITAAGIMKPLPVRPVDGITNPGTQAPLPRPVTGRVMRPLPVPNPDRPDMVQAIRTAAFERMLERLGVNEPLPLIDPTG